MPGVTPPSLVPRSALGPERFVRLRFGLAVSPPPPTRRCQLDPHSRIQHPSGPPKPSEGPQQDATRRHPSGNHFASRDRGSPVLAGAVPSSGAGRGQSPQPSPGLVLFLPQRSSASEGGTAAPTQEGSGSGALPHRGGFRDRRAVPCRCNHRPVPGLAWATRARAESPAAALGPGPLAGWQPARARNPPPHWPRSIPPSFCQTRSRLSVRPCGGASRVTGTSLTHPLNRDWSHLASRPGQRIPRDARTTRHLPRLGSPLPLSVGPSRRRAAPRRGQPGGLGRTLRKDPPNCSPYLRFYHQSIRYSLSSLLFSLLSLN